MMTRVLWIILSEWIRDRIMTGTMGAGVTIHSITLTVIPMNCDHYLANNSSYMNNLYQPNNIMMMKRVRYNQNIWSTNTIMKVQVVENVAFWPNKESVNWDKRPVFGVHWPLYAWRDIEYGSGKKIDRLRFVEHTIHSTMMKLTTNNAK